MANPELEKAPNYPFTAFNFAVEIAVPDMPGAACAGSFAECDGLEMTMDAKTLREGGNNTQQIRLTGPVNFGTLTLKRGMTANFDLWKWFGLLYEPEKGGIRATATVVVFAEDHQDPPVERVRFALA